MNVEQTNTEIENNRKEMGEINDAGEDGVNESPADKELTSQDEEEAAEPQVGMEFDTEDAAKTFYDAYARRMGFSTRTGQYSRSKSDGTAAYREFSCSKEGLKRKNVENCNAMFKIEKRDSGKWVATKFIKEHNHSTVSPSKVHHLRPRRHFAAAKALTETYSGAGFAASGAMYASMEGNRVPVESSFPARNISSVEASRAARYTAPASYMKPCNRKKTLDARSRIAYSHFGDSVTFDTMFRPNQYRVPFAPFTGINHHGQMVLFGCALILDESESSFLWVFKTWLEAMSNRAPVSLITDQDRAIQAAVAQVFPGTRHCICKWHILREGQERLAHVCVLHSNFQGELYNCINMTETIEEFESSWSSLLGKYELRQNDWLQALYNARQHWAPVYFRDTFFAAISSNSGVEVITSFFDGYVNQQTTLPLFFRQYERVMEIWYEKEIEADFDTICTTPVLKTPSPMEKQAANLYTKKIFTKFQEELVETFVYTANKIDGAGAISTYRVAKFEDDHKAYTVTMNAPEMKANCSCRMFEFSGILCRHILTVFTVTNVLTLPSHYILKRWTRNAKSSIGSDERGNELQGQESLTMRYNSLCREAIKYAEEGAIASETYNVAMCGLRDGGKKISVVKKTVARTAPPSSVICGGNVEDSNKKKAASVSDMSPSLWPRQDEAARRLNLNDTGASTPTTSVADLNLPRMRPVSLHRDEGPDNMVVLPCLKSMTWVMENRTSSPAHRVAVINLKLHDYGKSPSGESEVKFQLSRVTLEPMLKSMAYIGEQLSTPANRVAVINLKLQDTETISGESEVKFQVSRDTLGAMLRSMAYIREQLLTNAEPQPEPPSSKKQRK
ncbi:hypothetical protein MKX01_001290 [Papaver californicum]|nr:hypothetical protein MKX01_001290 [Papaver californicum]